MGQSYGFNRAENIDGYQTSSALIGQLINIISRGGNLLLNVNYGLDWLKDQAINGKRARILASL
jgi:alpha-L-fucosidase